MPLMRPQAWKPLRLVTSAGILMIKLTRLNGEPFVLNAELIRYVEHRPDTFITLTNGDRIVVSQSMEQVIELAVQYQQHKHFMPPPTHQMPPAATIPSPTNQA